MSIELKEDSWRISYLYKSSNGDVLAMGETAGAKTWLDHASYGAQNAIKRVKSKIGVKWAEKTTPAMGDGDIARKFDDGRTLQIWIDREGGSAPRWQSPQVSAVEGLRQSVIKHSVDNVLAGVWRVEDVYPDLRDEVENELAKRELGI